MVNRKSTPKLDRKAWISKGLEVLAVSGVEAVRVEPLAKMMQVTKGSFYWHFKNRAELLSAILAEWVNQETESIIERVEQADGTPREKLLYLFELAVQDDMQAERAIRAWATRDLSALETLHEVDQRRISYTQGLFVNVGFSLTEALVRARLVYYALIGEEQIMGQIDRAERLATVRHWYEILTHTNNENQFW